MLLPEVPLVWLTLAYAAGTAAGVAVRVNAGWPLVIALAGLACVVRAGARPAHPDPAGPPTAPPVTPRFAPRDGLLLAVFAAGLFLAAVAWSRLEPPPGLEPGPGGGVASRWVAVRGRVVSDVKPTGKGYRFLLKAATPGTYWRAGEVIYTAVRETPVTARPGPEGRPGAAGGGLPESGSLVRVAGFLSRPEPPGNPGEFDFGRYLAASGARSTLRAAGPPVVEAGPPFGSFAALCRAARDRLTSAIARGLPDAEAALLDGLLFGDTSRLPEDVARDFRRCGVYHVLAVSGSNVAFIAGGVWFCARPLLRAAGLGGARAERLLLPVTALVLAAYAVMSGLGPSVVRATVMAGAGLVYLGLGRRRSVWVPLCLAALVMLSRQPLVVLDVGFQLSFAATLGILAIYSPLKAWATVRLRLEERPRVARALVEAGLVSLAAQAAVLPLLATHFGEVSLAGLVANMVVVPLTGLALTAGLAAGMLGAAGGAIGRLAAVPFFLATLVLLRAAVWAAHGLARLPLASVIVGAPAAGWVIAYYLALVWVVRGVALGRAGRRAAVAVTAALAVAVGGLTPAVLTAGSGGIGGGGPEAAVEVVFLDVGQGDAAFIALPGGRTWLIDGGPAGAGENTIAPFLRHRGAGRVDTVFVSHFHDDHTGGLQELLADPGITLGEIVVPADGPGGGPLRAAGGALLAAAEARGVPVRETSAGDRVVVAGGAVTLTVLSDGGAAAGDAAAPGSGESSAENDASLILRLDAGPVAFLFPGDLEATGEADYLAAPGPRDRLRADVLKVAHHGSPYATSAGWLAAVEPVLAVCSVGTNTFGHPSPLTLERLARAGAVVFVTQPDGAVTVRMGGRGREAVLVVTGYRSGRRAVLPAAAASSNGGGEGAAGSGMAGKGATTPGKVRGWAAAKQGAAPFLCPVGQARRFEPCAAPKPPSPTWRREPGRLPWPGSPSFSARRPTTRSGSCGLSAAWSWTPLSRSSTTLTWNTRGPPFPPRGAPS